MRSLAKDDDNPWLVAELEEIKERLVGKFDFGRLYWKLSPFICRRTKKVES